MIPRLCIAHKPPQVAAHLYDVIIDTPPREGYEALTSVVAQPSMALLAPDTPVSVCGYRKIVLRSTPTGLRSKPHGHISLAECRQTPREQAEPPPGHDFLLCIHNFFKVGGVHKNMVDQWVGCHHGVDWYDIMGLAIEMRIFTPEEVHHLAEEPALVEGGFSMGVYPGYLLRSTIAKVMPLYREFARRHSARFMGYDPVQRRCLAFMAERVETYFILQELVRRYPSGFPNEIFGCLTTVNDGPWTAGTMP
jgi:hypothetical protein